VPPLKRFAAPDTSLGGLRLEMLNSIDVMPSSAVDWIQSNSGDSLYAVRRMTRSDRLSLAFYRRPTLEVARDLLGCRLCRRTGRGQLLQGTIVEVEAYDGPTDRASLASRGLTPRNTPMFEVGGIAYVYLIYGVHHCLNVVTGPADYPAAVLLRATEPPKQDISATGPGRLTRAYQVDRSLDGSSLCSPELWLEKGDPLPDRQIKSTPRIGVDYAGAWARCRYRFVVAGHPAVSGPRRLR
jgi:DNA-3-methyladenine glycosylase